jgi:hypothetical protein
VEISKITIDVSGLRGNKSIHSAWISPLELQDRYKSEVAPKIMVKKLLNNLLSVATRQVIRVLQDTGDSEQQATKGDTGMFHDLLVSIATTNKRAMEFGFVAVSKPASRSSSRALIAANHNASAFKRPTEKSKAALKEHGCKHHGTHSYHGTSECFIEHPELAPPGWDKEKAIRNAKRRQREHRQREEDKPTKAKAKAAKLAYHSETSDSDAVGYYAGRAYSANTQPRFQLSDYDYSESSDLYDKLFDDPESESDPDDSDLDVAASRDTGFRSEFGTNELGQSEEGTTSQSRQSHSGLRETPNGWSSDTS